MNKPPLTYKIRFHAVERSVGKVLFDLWGSVQRGEPVTVKVTEGGVHRIHVTGFAEGAKTGKRATVLYNDIDHEFVLVKGTEEVVL